ncbi:MAG: hypothetical protein L0Y54_13075 [Sporichthyaceae bacterium]|nr:hypothetical protein [Sporichthyaceae bacterium]
MPVAGAAAWLPEFDVREYHERVVMLAPEQAIAAVLELPVCPDPLVRALFRLRGFRATHESIGEFSTHHGFLELARTPSTYVFGLAARWRGNPRRAADPQSWRSWQPPGLKIAADFCAEPLGGGRTRLSTETRVLALDPRSRREFRLYWLVVGPFSALIRRRWLRAIETRAARLVQSVSPGRGRRRPRGAGRSRTQPPPLRRS